jgi:prepilin-type N-terminal cleavage/methylation domain-containing protein
MKLAHNFSSGEPGRGSARSSRAGFTLVELLVVIAIIIVLASLLLAAVFKGLDMANEAATRTDVTQLAAAVQSFQTKYQVGYIPSRIILCENYLNYFQGGNPSNGIVQDAAGYPSQLHADSLDYLQRVFPRITTGDAAHGGLPRWAVPNPNPDPSYFVGIDWNGDGAIQDPPMVSGAGIPMGVYHPNTGTVALSCFGSMLEGEQCLVFFTGGIPSQTSAGFVMTGFSTNASNPAALVGDRVAPFLEFKTNRLVQWGGTAPGYPSYLDGYGKSGFNAAGVPIATFGAPYAYFSSYKTANGYNRYANYMNPYLPLSPAPAGCQPSASDCQALPFAQWQQVSGQLVLAQGFGVWPYVQSVSPTTGAPNYLNAQTAQIISAGKDGFFGPGTMVCTYLGVPWTGTPFWTPQGATAVYPQQSQGGVIGGYDDIANFYDRQLGVQTQ